MKGYTKSQLEEIVCTQLENLMAMQDLVRIMKVQNELIGNANKKLRDEIDQFKVSQLGSNKKKAISPAPM